MVWSMMLVDSEPDAIGRTLNTCSDLYAHFHHELCEASYYPFGAPQISDNHIVS